MGACRIGDLTAWTTSVMLRLWLVALLAAAPARAQYAASCPPPKKLAAGACVTACPAGYEDRGSECVYRSLSR